MYAYIKNICIIKHSQEKQAFEDVQACQLLRHMRHLRIHSKTKHLVIHRTQFNWKTKLLEILRPVSSDTFKFNWKNMLGHTQNSIHWKTKPLEILCTASCCFEFICKSKHLVMLSPDSLENKTFCDRPIRWKTNHLEVLSHEALSLRPSLIVALLG